ncbi:UNVERIFIED_CONTAM: hypothetical protein NCL1_18170 [Trichonephila clavipes]
MACDAKDCGFQMLNNDEIGTSVQEDTNHVENKRIKTKKAMTATKVKLRHSAPISHFLEARFPHCPASYTAWNAFGFRLSEQSRIRMVSGPNWLR